MGDYIDEKLHTREQAARQHPNLDLDAPAASQESPAVSGAGERDTSDVMVPAQTPEEVQAQIDNPAGAPDDTHDQSEQMEAAAALGTDEDDEDDDPDDE